MDNLFGYSVKSLIAETANSKIYRVSKDNKKICYQSVEKEISNPHRDCKI